jgi:cobalt-precorrin 5A hydrolase/precorrin-3B C17-methyltransferase
LVQTYALQQAIKFQPDRSLRRSCRRLDAMSVELPEKMSLSARDLRRRPLPPQVLALGIGCERGCSAREIAALADATLAEAGFVIGSVAAVVSIELKHAEPGILALAARIGAPVWFFTAARLLAETERLSERSAAAFRATGCWGVAEGAALAACGTDGILLVPKRRSRRATCAVAQASAPIDVAALRGAR